MTPLTTLSTTQKRYPASGLSYSPQNSIMVEGFVGTAKTDKSRSVDVFVPAQTTGTIYYNPLFQPKFGKAELAPAQRNSVQQVDFRYFCHGHSLGTHQAFGYSVFSGDPLLIVLADEWEQIDAPLVGGIVVWFKPDTGDPWHSAIVVSTQVNAMGASIVTVSTKNGFFEVPLLQWETDISHLYGTERRYFRRKA